MADTALAGGTRDKNAKQWVRKETESQSGSLNGEWSGRWLDGSGKATVREMQDRIFFLFTDTEGPSRCQSWLLEAVRDGKDRLVGRWQRVGFPEESGLWIGLIVDNERIDGTYNHLHHFDFRVDRWDFRRKASPPNRAPSKRVAGNPGTMGCPKLTETETIDMLFRGFANGDGLYNLALRDGLFERGGSYGATICNRPTGIRDVFRRLLFQPSHKRGESFYLLGLAAKRVPVQTDEGLAAIARWARHPDSCVRHIAMAALATGLGNEDEADLLKSGTFTGLSDPEDFGYHRVFQSLKARLDRGSAAYDPKIFEGLMLDVEGKSYKRQIEGTWKQETDSGFIQIVHVDRGRIRVTERDVDGGFFEVTWTSDIRSVAINASGQFELTGTWRTEKWSDDPEESRIEGKFVYTFWLMKTGVAWFSSEEDVTDEANNCQSSPGSFVNSWHEGWAKFRRVR